jgi:hypothetical protein
MSLANNKITAPKCCQMCDNWKLLGREDDSNSPLFDSRGNRKQRSRYGKCSVKKLHTFFDQSCARFTAPDEIEIFEIKPQARVFEPMQGELL